MFRAVVAAGALCCAMPASSVVLPFTAASLQPAVQSYPAMLIKLKAGESIDMRRLRDAYRRDPSYTGRFGIDTRVASAALEKGRNDKVLKMVDAALRKSFVDIDAHFLAAAAHDAEGRNDQAAFERGIASALLDAIFATGDGNSAKTAYRVLSVHEEYVVASVLDLKVEGQSLRTEGGYYDVMQVTDQKSGDRREIWFDISAFIGPKLASR
jgi:hypothetical protein